ncbi:MAG: hypothetical protein ACREVE_10285 [Gammaproteobacteria bacterium]
MKKSLSGALGDSVYGSLWVPARIDPMWIRCGSCRQVSDYEKSGGVCACGENLPDPPSYW